MQGITPIEESSKHADEVNNPNPNQPGQADRSGDEDEMNCPPPDHPRKADGFPDERYYIIPTELFAEYMGHPLIRSLYLTDIGYFPNAQDHFRERGNGADQYILIFCDSGRGVVEIEDCRYVLEARTALCIPREKRHRYYADENAPWSIYWMHFLGDNTAFFPLDKCEIVQLSSVRGVNRLKDQFHMLFRVLDCSYTVGNFAYISQLAGLILSEIYFREKTEEPASYEHHITAAIQYMMRHLDQMLTLQQISDAVGLSRSYLNGIFKGRTGHAPVDFFIRLKMQEACKMLKMTDLYIYEVGNRLGYEDPYYFSRIFRKIVGVSPKEYRLGDYPDNPQESWFRKHTE